MLVTAFSIGAAIAAAVLVCAELRRAQEWEQTAARAQDAAAKARMENEKLRVELADAVAQCKRTDKKLRAAELELEHLKRREESTAKKLADEIDKSTELRRIVDETRGMLDEERGSYRRLYDEYTDERDAFARLKEEHRALKAREDEISAMRQKLEDEKSMLVELTNLMNYRGTEDGQIDIPQR